MQAALDYKQDTLVLAGGVSANRMLRDKVTLQAQKHQMRLYMPPLKYCGDNAAMIAAQAYYEYQNGVTAQTNLNAYATMDIASKFTEKPEF